jgi:hypothetical protein
MLNAAAMGSEAPSDGQPACGEPTANRVEVCHTDVWLALLPGERTASERMYRHGQESQRYRTHLLDS